MRSITLVVMVALLAALLTATLAAGAPVTIVDAGQPAAVIVTQPEPPAEIARAMNELQDCVREASGAELQIVTEPVDGMAAIHLGETPYALAQAIEIDSDDVDAYAIRFPEPNTIVVLGNSPSGTQFGTFGFLKRFLGVRWLLPGDDGRDVPGAQTIAIPDEPVSDAPAFMSRLFSGGRSAHGEWAIRNGMHGTISFHHNLRVLYDAEVFAEDRPEFYPLVNDERFSPLESAARWQPCFTAPGIVETGAQRIIEYFDAHPDAISYSLGINDTNMHCQCPTCTALDPGRENFLGLPHLSDRYFTWANAVVERVLEVYPDKYFGCLAYNNVVEPPDRVEVHPRIIPYMTYDRMKWSRPEIEQQGHDLTEAWAEKCPTLGWYDYIYGTPYMLPRYYPHAMREYLQWGYEHGVRSLYAEAYPNFGEGPKLYAYLALNWDPSLDIDALLDDWFERCCGPESGQALRSYYEFWEEFWTERIPQESDWFSEGGQYLRFNGPQYLLDVTLEEIAQCRTWLEEAVANAQTDKQRGRGDLLMRAFEYYEASALAYPRLGDSKSAPETEEEALAQLAGNFDPVAYAQKRLDLALEFENDPVLVHPLPPTRYATTSGSGWGTNRMWQLYEWVKNSDAVRARVTELAEQSQFEMVRLNARLLLKVASGEAEALNVNSGFEEGEDWATGWSPWVKFGIGTNYRSTEIAHTGEASLCFDGMKRGGPTQTLRLEPGSYALTGFVYIPEGQETMGTVAVMATPRDAAGVNLPGGISSEIVPAQGRWQPIAAAGTIPAEIGGKPVVDVMFLPLVDGWDPDGKIYIDDLSIVKLD